MFYPRRQREMKALQVYKFTFNNDFMMNRELFYCDQKYGHVIVC